MNHQWAKLSLVVFTSVTVALASNHEKSGNMSGSFEGGVGYSAVSGGAKGGQWFVDGLHLRHQYDVSDKIKVVLHNAIGINSPNGGPVPGGAATGFNGSTYFSGATIAVAGSSLMFSNLAAYIQHECAKGLFTSVGHMRVPVGMESMWSRYDMHSYYYSPVYTLAQVSGWNYDLGLKFHLVDILPGSLEVAVVDGRTGGRAAASKNPGVAGRWHYEWKGGDWSLTPVVSFLGETWNGGPDHLGITAGAMFKMGALWLNGEWYYTGIAAVPGGAKTKVWNVMAEPGFDFGFMDASVKYAFVNNSTTSTTDHSVGFAFSKTYEDKQRVKVAYQFGNLSGKLGAKTHDVRLLFATNW